MVRTGERVIAYGLGVGSADVLVIVSPSGRCGWLEVKAPGGRVSEQQQRFLDRMRARGCGAAVVRSVEEAVTAVEGWR
jgi:hypothetical protein